MAFAAPKKGASAKSNKPPQREKDMDTAYTVPLPEKTEVVESRPMPEAKRNIVTEKIAKSYSNSYGLFLGIYNAEVLGANPYASFLWDYFPARAAFFFEGTAGIGRLQSSFSESVHKADIFDNNLLVTLEALAGYSMSWDGYSGEMYSGGHFPYFIGGITALYQGGSSNIGGVLGFGQRTKLPGLGKKDCWALNYGLRDHIYSQKITTKPYITQNFIFLIGVQYYY